jgi:hypothetical protein
MTNDDGPRKLAQAALRALTEAFFFQRQMWRLAQSPVLQLTPASLAAQRQMRIPRHRLGESSALSTFLVTSVALSPTILRTIKRMERTEDLMGHEPHTLAGTCVCIFALAMIGRGQRTSPRRSSRADHREPGAAAALTHAHRRAQQPSSDSRIPFQATIFVR